MKFIRDKKKTTFFMLVLLVCIVWAMTRANDSNGWFVKNWDSDVLSFSRVQEKSDDNLKEYVLIITDYDNEKMAAEINRLYNFVNEYLQSEDYDGQPISILIWSDSVHYHAYQFVATMTNMACENGYYLKGDLENIENRIAYIEVPEFDNGNKYYDSSVDYKINHVEYWENLGDARVYYRSGN